MESLNDFSWVAKSQYHVLGTRFEVRSDDAQVATRVDSLLKPFVAGRLEKVEAANVFSLATRLGDDDRHHVYRDETLIGRSDSWPKILDPFLGDLNRRAVGAMRYFGVHAGVVAKGDRTVVIPGTSGSGKSTLVAACIREGFSYLSDEALCVDYDTGLVVPYPKPLSLSGRSLGVLGVDLPELVELGGTKTPIGPEALGGSLAQGPSRLSDFISFERRPGEAHIQPAPASVVIAGLLKYSFNHYKRPADAFLLTSELARQCRGWALGFDDPIEAAALLGSVISR